ncbi:MAG: glycosyltransferase [Pyrinomonadaceae bacterium]
MKSLVSVIIPNYNYEHYLSEAVDSVLAQTYPNIEIIIVDDGSKDNSRETIESYGDKVTAIFQKNQGVSAARNNGVATSSGKFVAFLDADDVWLPEKLERQIARFDADEKIAFVHCSMTLVSSEGELLGEESDGQEGSVADEFLRFERGVVIGAASTGVVLRKVFDEIGGFDKRQSTAADWDFAYRIAAKYEIGFVPESLVRYRMHGSNMHGNIKAMEHDMLLGYEKAFANGATADRYECYGNLHLILAGSYFYAGQYADFARHTFKSIWNRPSNFGYFARFPIRRLQRK